MKLLTNILALIILSSTTFAQNIPLNISYFKTATLSYENHITYRIDKKEAYTGLLLNYDKHIKYGLLFSIKELDFIPTVQLNYNDYYVEFGRGFIQLDSRIYLGYRFVLYSKRANKKEFPNTISPKK